jgi:hypothetical protein
MVLSVCRERDELEKQINALLRSLSQNSRKAAGLAMGAKPSTDAAEFGSLHQDDVLLRERLEALKYCLQLHKDCHGCLAP